MSESTLTNYQIQNTLGEGTFGKVKLAIHIQTGEKVYKYERHRLQLKF